MTLILIDDTIFNVNTIHEFEAIKKINSINILDQMIQNYEEGVMANDFDNLGFLVQLWTKLLTHLGKHQFSLERTKKTISRTISFVLCKHQVLSIALNHSFNFTILYLALNF